MIRFLEAQLRPPCCSNVGSDRTVEKTNRGKTVSSDGLTLTITHRTRSSKDHNYDWTDKSHRVSPAEDSESSQRGKTWHREEDRLTSSVSLVTTGIAVVFSPLVPPVVPAIEPQSFTSTVQGGSEGETHTKSKLPWQESTVDNEYSGEYNSSETFSLIAGTGTATEHKSSRGEDHEYLTRTDAGSPYRYKLDDSTTYRLDSTSELRVDKTKVLTSYKEREHAALDSWSGDGSLAFPGDNFLGSPHYIDNLTVLTGGMLQKFQWGMLMQEYPAPVETWTPPGTAEFLKAYVSDLAGWAAALAEYLSPFGLLGGFGPLGNFSFYLGSTTAPDPAAQGGLFGWLGENVMRPLIGDERLLQGDGFLDNLLLAGILATEIVGYVDPTPLSDGLNAALNALDGRYGDAAMSLGGAFIPFGFDKGAKAGARVGSNVLGGFSAGIGGLARRIDCGDPNAVFRTMGRLSGQCFVGDTLVVLDFADDAGGVWYAAGTGVPAIEATGSVLANQHVWLAAGASAFVIGVGGAVVRDRRRRRQQEDRKRRAREAVFAEGRCGDVDLDSALRRSLEELTPPQFEELCDRLFARDALATEVWRETDAYDDRMSNQSPSRDHERTPAQPSQLGSPSAATLAVRPSRSIARTVAHRLRRSRDPAAKPRVQRRRSPASDEPQRRPVNSALLWLVPWLVAAASFLGLAWMGDGPSSSPRVASLGPSGLVMPHDSARADWDANLASLGPTFRTSPSGVPAVLDARVWREAVQASAKYKTQEIRDVQVGTWVLADNPQTADGEEVSDFGEIVPGDWRHLALRMQKADGGTLDIDLLRPLWWLALQAAEHLPDDEPLPDDTGETSIDAIPALIDALAASLVPGDTIELDLAELGAAGPAEILSIRFCPVLRPSPSPHHRLVTGKFSHSSADILHVFVEGLPEPIGVTANHPFWSEDRQDFVPACELHPGETLARGEGPTARVLGFAQTALREPVYNLEVDGEHVYYVSAHGLLVHNNCGLARMFDGPIHHIASDKDKLFTPLFEKLFNRAGLDLQTPWNQMRLQGHVGPHGKFYNQYVLDRLLSAVGTRTGNAARRAIVEELKALRRDIRHKGLDALLKARASVADVLGNF